MNSVDANYRFIAASNEVNARIAQRQQTLALYVTLTLGLVAALVGFHGSGAAGAGGSAHAGAGGGVVPVTWLSLGFPVASLTLVLLSVRTENAVSNLRRFLATLEQLDDAHLRLPSYNTDPAWALNANRARRLHDYTAALLVLAANAVALGALEQLYPADMGVGSPVAWIITIVALGCVAVLLRLPRLAYVPASAASAATPPARHRAGGR